MNTYTCSICGINDNRICSAIGVTTPHGCPYNLGDFDWKTNNKSLNHKQAGPWQCQTCHMANDGWRKKCHACNTPEG